MFASIYISSKSFVIFNLLRFEGQNQQVDKFLPQLFDYVTTLITLYNKLYDPTGLRSRSAFSRLLTNLEKNIKRHAVYKLAFKPGGMSAP